MHKVTKARFGYRRDGRRRLNTNRGRGAVIDRFMEVLREKAKEKPVYCPTCRQQCFTAYQIEAALRMEQALEKVERQLKESSDV